MGENWMVGRSKSTKHKSARVAAVVGMAAAAGTAEVVADAYDDTLPRRLIETDDFARPASPPSRLPQPSTRRGDAPAEIAGKAWRHAVDCSNGLRVLVMGGLKVKYARRSAFYEQLCRRVDAYFQSTGLSPRGH